MSHLHLLHISLTLFHDSFLSWCKLFSGKSSETNKMLRNEILTVLRLCSQNASNLFFSSSIVWIDFIVTNVLNLTLDCEIEMQKRENMKKKIRKMLNCYLKSCCCFLYFFIINLTKKKREKNISVKSCWQTNSVQVIAIIEITINKTK